MPEQSTIDVKFELMLSKMDNLNEKYAVHAAQDLEHFGQIREKLGNLVEKVDSLLLDSERGVVVRVDRLMQSEQKRSWLVRAAVGSGLTSICAHVWQFIKS